MNAILHWVVYESADVMQGLLLLTFLFVSLSPAHRKTGIVLMPFAVLYFILIPINGYMNDLSPPVYALIYAMMDYSAAYLVIKFGSKGSVNQGTILSLFVLSHLMAYGYASGYMYLLNPVTYGVLNFFMIILQIIFSIPGIRGGFNELFTLAWYLRASRVKVDGLHFGGDSRYSSPMDPICDSNISGEGGSDDYVAGRVVVKIIPFGQLVR